MEHKEYLNKSAHRILSHCQTILEEKMALALKVIFPMSKYQPDEYKDEIGVGSTLLLALIQGLNSRDIALVVVLVEVMSFINHLKSTQFLLWLQEDYKWDSDNLNNAIKTAIWLKNNNIVTIPQNIFNILYKLQEELGGIDQGGCSLTTASQDLREETSSGYDSSCELNVIDDAGSNEQILDSRSNFQLNNIFDYVPRKDISSIQEYIAKGGDVNKTNDRGESLLHLAVKEGELEAVKFLIKSGARVNKRDNNMMTPIHEAINSGYDHILDALIEGGADIDCTLFHGETLLMYAVSKNRLTCIKTLLIHKVDIRVRNYSGKTALIIAVELGHYEIVRVLLTNASAEGVVTDSGESLLHLSTLRRDVKIMKLLIDDGVDMSTNNDGLTPLHIAVKNNYLEGIQIFSSAGFDIDSVTTNGMTALHLAAAGGHVESISLLLELGANVDSKDLEGFTPLCVAAEYGRSQAAKALIVEKAEINYRNNNGYSPLYLALAYSQYETFSVLHNLGGFLDGADIFKVVEEGNTEKMKLLKNAGYDFNIKDDDSLSPLHWTAKCGYQNATVWLLDIGMDIEVKTQWNSTPLHFAAEEGYLDIVKLLIERGAEINARNDSNKTPLKYALSEDWKEVAEYISSKGGSE